MSSPGVGLDEIRWPEGSLHFAPARSKRPKSCFMRTTLASPSVATTVSAVTRPGVRGGSRFGSCFGFEDMRNTT